MGEETGPSPDKKKPKTVDPGTCNGCGKVFPSRNAVFKHLKDTDGACLSPDDYKDFVRYVRKSVKPPKVVILYGYLPHNGCDNSPAIRNGQDAGSIIMEAIQKIQNEIDGFDDDEDEKNNNAGSSSVKVNRSYGHFSRAADCVRQDLDTGAVTEVMTMRLYPLRADMSVDDWLDRVQKNLNGRFEHKQGDVTTDSCGVSPIRILGRQDMPNKKFNAEMDVTYRRVEYLLPMDFLTWPLPDENQKKIRNLPIFASNHKHDIHHVSDAAHPPDEWAKCFMREFKNKMKMLTTRVVKLEATDEVGKMEKEFNMKKLKYVRGKVTKKSKKEHRKAMEEANETKSAVPSTGDQAEDAKREVKKEKSDKNNDKNSDDAPKAKATNVLKRKRYHNFTEKSMAHDYLTYRRMDRIYHRASLKFCDESNVSVEKAHDGRTYLVLSLSGDLFLTGQVSRVVGLLVALANGVIEPDFVDCVFDENFPHLVPTPPAPLCGMVSAEIHYANQEGKTKRILSPRVSTRFSEGWNNEGTLLRVKDWQNEVYKFVVQKWKQDGWDENGRLRSEEEWTKNTLLPWAEKAKRQLEEYKAWKKSLEQAAATTDSNGNSDTNSKDSGPMVVDSELSSIDPTVPDVFQDVLGHLRQLDSSGKWPTTSSKRQLVMIATDSAGDNETLTIACSKAKRNIQTVSSAYSFKEGQGGASGSFSVGYFPGDANKQPKANAMFPDLVKAAFDLETKLFPDREPSSTIAINRNAQFRPHTDSGAGAGQSRSLIVGLGTYAGGELMVEGESNDIRYKGIEFDGWKQRHWTMPFQGERYSLVWFTPKGCEGMKGINLYSN